MNIMDLWVKSSDINKHHRKVVFFGGENYTLKIDIYIYIYFEIKDRKKNFKCTFLFWSHYPSV